MVFSFKFLRNVFGLQVLHASCFTCFFTFLTFQAWGGYSKAAAEQRMRDFHSQSLANTAWAFASMGYKEERLFTALAAAAERRMRDFTSQDLANTAWAFATLGHKEERLFMALAAAAAE